MYSVGSDGVRFQEMASPFQMNGEGVSPGLLFCSPLLHVVVDGRQLRSTESLGLVPPVCQAGGKWGPSAMPREAEQHPVTPRAFPKSQKCPCPPSLTPHFLSFYLFGSQSKTRPPGGACFAGSGGPESEIRQCLLTFHPSPVSLQTSVCASQIPSLVMQDSSRKKTTQPAGERQTQSRLAVPSAQDVSDAGGCWCPAWCRRGMRDFGDQAYNTWAFSGAQNECSACSTGSLCDTPPQVSGITRCAQLLTAGKQVPDAPARLTSPPS